MSSHQQNGCQKIMIHNAIFQTPIFIKSLDGLTDRENLYELIGNEVEVDWSPDWKYDIFQSASRHLHTSDRYQNFVKEIHTAIKETCNIYQYQEYTIEITEMWGNRQRPGTHFKYHRHNNNIFSTYFMLI